MFKEQPRKKISTRSKREEPPIFFKVAYFIMLVVFFGVTVYVLMFSSFMRVNHLNFEGAKELEYEKVYAAAKALIVGKYLNIFPKDNFFMISKKKIQRNLLDEFKKIRVVEVEKKFPDTVNIKIEEREALVIWCAKGPCYIIDEQGFAYAGADFNSDELKENNLVKLVDINAEPVIIGERILDEDYVKFIFSVRESFRKNLDINIADEYTTRHRISGEIEVKTEEGWDVYLNNQLSLEKSMRTLKTFLEKEIDGEASKRMEYVDLRIENKVFYKIRDEENQEGGEDVSEKNSNSENIESAVLPADEIKADNKKKKKEKKEKN